jgi:hypothetical protein
MNLVRLVRSAEEAAAEIAQFYHNYHSSRWLKGLFMIRMNHALNETALGQIQEDFAQLCIEGSFTQQSFDESEKDEPEFSDLVRLAFRFNGRDHGRLRELIDRLNLPQNWAIKA